MGKTKISFEEKDQRIGFEEADKIHYRLNKNLVVGIELETQNKDNHREALTKKFKPTGSYHGVTKERVVEVKGDGSLYSNGAIEIVTIGDNGSFEDQRDALALIETELLKKGFYTDSQTGQHTSLLLQKNFQVPDLVMRNIFQVTKLFLPEITYLVSTGVNPDVNEGVIRKGAKEFANWKHNETTALGKTFRTLREKMGEQNSAGGKYGFFNFYKCKLIPETNDCGHFFIEYRIPDRCMSPSISIAWGSMFKAIVLKACSMSKYGLVTMSNDEWKAKKKQYDELFTSDRRKILRDKDLKEQVKIFLDFLTPEFKRMGEAKALKILYKLAITPLFSNKYYLTEEKAKGVTEPLWVKIEKEFLNLTDKRTKTLTSKEFLIKQVLDEGLTGNKGELVKDLQLKTQLTNKVLNTKLQTLGLKYDSQFKTFVQEV